MPHLLFVQWKEDNRGIDCLRDAGFQVEVHTGSFAPAEFRAIQEKPPDAFVIDLFRLPSYGRGMAIWLRNHKTTRLLPIIFLEGAPEKTRPVRQALPDAIFATEKSLVEEAKKAMRRPLTSPVIPKMMEDYSGSPLPKKLGIKKDSIVALLGAPPGFEKTLHPLPEGVYFLRRPGEAQIVLLFARRQAELKRLFAEAGRLLQPKGRLWIIWPKRASGEASDLTQNEVRAFGLEAGYVDFKIIAVDATWSGLCFARRKSGP